MTQQQNVHIIGAGLGGLTLGKALQKHGIASKIYEKSDGSPRHSYGITLNAKTYRPLLQTLALDEQSFRQQLAVDAPTGGEGRLDTTQTAQAFRANRSRLEQLLAEKLDIDWAKEVHSAIESEESVTLQLETGEKIEDGIIIAGDGVHSSIRKSLIPAYTPSVLPIVALNGKYRVSKADFDRTFAPSLQGKSVAELVKAGTLLNVSINETSDEKVSISWTFSRSARGSDDALYKPNRPNAGAKDIPDAFYQEIASLGDLPQPFKSVFDQDRIRQDRTLHWLMRTTAVAEKDLVQLAKKNVFFIGDAVHAQPILGGEGANEAITDGLQLANALANGGVDEARDWYTSRIPEWKAGVEKSEQRIAEMHAEQKSAL